MTMPRPIWFDYVEWDYPDPSFPVIKGLRKDTPPEIMKEFRKDQREFRKAEKEGVLLQNDSEKTHLRSRRDLSPEYSQSAFARSHDCCGRFGYRI